MGHFRVNLSPVRDYEPHNRTSQDKVGVIALDIIGEAVDYPGGDILPFNPHPGLAHARPADDSVTRFRDTLLSRGIDVSIRFSKGRDVAGACGQLVAPRPPDNGRIPA